MAHQEEPNTIEFTSAGAFIGFFAYIAMVIVIALPFL